MSTAALLGDNYSLNHHWDAVGEFVYMRRSHLHKHTLVNDADKAQCPGKCPNYTVMSTKNLVNDFHFEPGYRVGLSYMMNPRTSFKANYLWVSEWEGEKRVHGDQSLSFPFDNINFTEDFSDASEAIGKYRSNFWNAELNYWHHFNPPRTDYFGLSFIGGLRYFHINEAFSLTMVTPPDRSSYEAWTSNKVPALQVGLDFQMNPYRWMNWEAFAKVGPLLNYSRSRVLLRDENNQVVLRHAQKHETQWGIFTDVAAQLAVYPLQWFNLHVGYEVIYLSGLALAPEQLSKKTTPHAGEKDNTHGFVFVHGLYAGLAVNF